MTARPDHRSARDPWFDNIKIAVLALVVAGHIIETWIGSSQTALAVYNVIYLFHMPAIIVVSGAFVNAVHAKGKSWSQAARFMLMYLVFQSLFSALYFHLLEAPVHEDFTRPVFALWFLPAVAVWTLVTPVLMRVPYVVALSVILAVAAGYVESIGVSFSLSRILMFLPFFLAGAQLGVDGVRQVLVLRRRTATLGLLLTLAVMLSTIPWVLADDLFLARDSYRIIGLEGLQAGLLRTLYYILSGFAVVCFLALIPDKNLPVTTWGRFTLQIYILHSAVIYSARLAGVLPETPSLVAMLTGLVLWTLCLWGFSRPALARFLRPILTWR